jgi:hypothetical protein
MADKILRFKDILEMDQKRPLADPRPMSFNDMHVTQYRPGEDELINYRAYRRHRTIGVGEGGPIGESVEVDEALNVQQRLARKRMFKRIQPKIKRGKEIAKRRIASKEKLMSRTRKQIRLQFFKKFTKDIPKGELTYARRQEIEKRLEKPAIKKRIEQLAKKQFPKVKQAELAKKRGGSK